MPPSITTSHVSISADLPAWAIAIVATLALLSVTATAFEAGRSRRSGLLVFVSGLFAVGALTMAVLRPTRVTEKERQIPSRVVVLADNSRSMELSADGHESRLAARDRIVAALSLRQDVRVSVLGFGAGAPSPLATGEGQVPLTVSSSDLGTALNSLGGETDPPAAVVVVSDGRLDDPPATASDDALAAYGRRVRAPIDTVAVATRTPRDASVRKVEAVGSAVAHVPLQLRVEVGCEGGLDCRDIPVSVRELREGGSATELASARATTEDGSSTVLLTITLDRAGPRVIEVAIDHRDGDEVPENDRRFITFHVARERVRVLHVAGRPTDDVRAFRRWIKSNPSIDTVAFFILRTPTDTPLASTDELSLIPFPVDELFTAHLPSFDAVILQDFDAQPYGLEQHLPALARYVQSGGGLVMVGGLNSFVAGGYASSPLSSVLPVALDGKSGATAADTSPFSPVWTSDGVSFPALTPLRDAVGPDLPEMPGANVLGDPHEGAVVLWAHPTRHTPHGARMPVLAVANVGNGRSIALGVDGTWQLHFSPLGASTGGVGYGALWEGLLGWLMHDPRYEPVRASLATPCTGGSAATVQLDAPSNGPQGPSRAKVEVLRLDKNDPPRRVLLPLNLVAGRGQMLLPPLPSGGYVARIQLDGALSAELVFACETGGDEWADSRPDPDRLRRLARSTGGAFTASSADGARDLPLPKAKRVVEEPHSAPLVASWKIALTAAALLAAHWMIRRRRGLA